MPHPSSLRAALTGAGVAMVSLLLAVLPLLATPRAHGAPATSDPLLVHLDTISPVVPRTGSVEITGTVTNATDEDYTRINLHAFGSRSPISDAPSLAASAATAPEEFVGERITAPGTFDTVDILAPGSTADFSLSVPVELLGIDGGPGVYWIGVHALGDSIVPRDLSADGRARTFIPVLPEGRQRLEAAIVVPLRGAIRYAPDGAVAGRNRWLRALSPEGRLHNLLEVVEAGEGTTFTWLVDPAVLDAVTRLAAGNPARSLAPDPTAPGQAPQTPDDEGGDGPDGAETLAPPTPEPTDEEPSREDREVAEAAKDWLDRFVATTADRSVLALPYADLDVSAAVRHDEDRFEQARARSTELLTALGIPSRPALAPENDVVTPEVLSATPTDTVVLLGDTAFAAPPDTPHALVRMLGNKIVVTSSGAQMGGPGPTPAHDPLAMRQRLISEAALRLAQGSRAPVVMTLPPGWHPEDAADLFSAFEERWLTSVSVPDITDRPAVGLPTRALAYTEADLETELTATSFATARRLTDAAAVMEKVLTLDTTVEAQVLDEALATLSQRHRDRPRRAIDSALRAHAELTGMLQSIRLEVQPVILSSNSGTLGATIVNGLDQPVTVVVDAVAQDGLELRGPDARRLAGGARSQVRFEAHATRPGVHNVRLRVTTEDGTQLGSSTMLPIRATEVSVIIWVAMAAGAALLFGAIGVRLWRQLRRRRAASGEEVA